MMMPDARLSSSYSTSNNQCSRDHTLAGPIWMDDMDDTSKCDTSIEDGCMSSKINIYTG